MVRMRKATRADAQAIWDLRNASIMVKCKGYYPDATLRKWTSGVPAEPFYGDVQRDCYLAIDSEGIAGFGMIDLERARVKSLFVHPRHVAKGIGKLILSHLENLARNAGLEQLSLDSSLNAAPFYRTCGFTGDAAGKYESANGVILDCIPMSKRL